MSTDAPMLDRLTGKAALAALPPADGRSHQPDFAIFADRDDDGVDPADTTTIRHGAQADIGKASWSVPRTAIAADVLARYEQGKKQLQQRAAAEARELALLAEWNARKTVIGGVEMTNAEAQDARQRVIDHGDHYAEWAVQQGHIRADQKDEFVEQMRRKKELEDRRGRGILTAEEEREAAAMDRSQMGYALDAATAESHMKRGPRAAAELARGGANDTLRRPADQAPAVDPGVFQAYETETTVPMVPPPAKASRVAATGLDL